MGGGIRGHAFVMDSTACQCLCLALGGHYELSKEGTDHVSKLLEDATQLVNGALYILHGCRSARQVCILAHHHLLLLL